MIENLVDTLEIFFASKMEGVHTCVPGRIESFSGFRTRLASVKPLIRMQTNSGVTVELPVIQNVPVMFPSSKDFSMTYPLSKGDGCLIMFSEVGIGNFLNGNTDVDPDDMSRFSLTDAIAIPGLWSKQSVPSNSNIDEDAFNLSFRGSKVSLSGDSFSMSDSSGNTIESTPSSIKLNGNLEVLQ